MNLYFNLFKVKILFFLPIFVFLFLIVSSCYKEDVTSVKNNKTNYYINSITGNDDNNGKSKKTAWKNLSKIQKIDLNPGDKILLKSDSEFKQPIVLQNVNGTKENPIVITSYNSSIDTNKNRAIINVEGVPNGISIVDCSNILIKNLIINANPAKNNSIQNNAINMRCGILIKSSKKGIYQNIIMDNLLVKNVFFEKEGFTRPKEEVQTSNGKQKYGWGIRIINLSKEATIKNITLKNCVVENVSHTGIKFTGKNTNIKNIIVENCKILKTGGPGIQISGVEKGHIFNNNINKSGNKNDSRKWGRGSGLWTWASSNILIEKNHFLNANGPGDSAGCHIDFNCKNIIVQYNFSANNAGGFCEILGNNYNCSYRYNISINDGYRVKGENGAFQEGKTLWLSGYVGRKQKRKGPFNTYIYNNTIFVSENIVSKFAFDKTASGVLIMNNIFYIEGKSKAVLGDQYKPENNSESNIKNIVFENNIFLNSKNWPSEVSITDKSPLFGNPNFKNKGGMTIADYIPKNKNLIVDNGQRINVIPNDHIGLTIDLKVTHDILGNPISNTPDMGAIEIITENN